MFGPCGAFVSSNRTEMDGRGERAHTNVHSRSPLSRGRLPCDPQPSVILPTSLRHSLPSFPPRVVGNPPRHLSWQLLPLFSPFLSVNRGVQPRRHEHAARRLASSSGLALGWRVGSDRARCAGHVRAQCWGERCARRRICERSTESGRRIAGGSCQAVSQPAAQLRQDCSGRGAGSVEPTPRHTPLRRCGALYGVEEALLVWDGREKRTTPTIATGLSTR